LYFLLNERFGESMEMSPAMIWAAVGLVLLIIEIFTLSFGVLFFGISALVVAGIKATTGMENLATELLLFAIIGGACVLIFRKKLLQAFGKGARVNTDTATIIVLSAPIPPKDLAKVEYQGTIWDAYNESDSHLKAGDKAVITNTDGIKLIVKPIQR